LQALGLEKDDLVQALGLSFTVSTLALAAGLAHDGAFEASLAGASSLALVPALAGMLLGQRIRGRVRPETFRLCFFLGLLALGGHLALRS
ncbi:MAG TPA: TSUP family transporter, partial [Arenibaculum sp.]|nr:TSUP family transporter [Arenibaculum sp.]